MADKKFYGLIIPQKSKKVQSVSKSIFYSDSEDESPRLPTKRERNSQQASSKCKREKEKLTQEDPTIYEYDSIYDTIKAEKSQKQEKAKKEPRYIQSLLKAADKRKKDHDRRLEKKIETERMKEGDEFKDKESFVTSAYKQKMLEMEKEEEEERRQAQLEEMMDVTKQQDLSGFYRHYLNQTIGEEKVPVFGGRNLASFSQSGENNTEVKSIKVEKADNLDPSADKHTSQGNKILDNRIKESNEKNSAHSKKHSKLLQLSDNDDGHHTLSHGIRGTMIKGVEKERDIIVSSNSPHDRKYGLSKTQEDAVYEDYSSRSSGRHEEHGKIRHKRRHDSSSSSSSSLSEFSNKKLVKVSNEEESKSKGETSCQEVTTNIDDKDDNDVLDSDADFPHDDKDDDNVLDSDADSLHDNNKEVKKDKVVRNPKLEMSYKFMKRTVGEVFHLAQERYFKRLAARGT